MKIAGSKSKPMKKRTAPHPISLGKRWLIDCSRESLRCAVHAPPVYLVDMSRLLCSVRLVLHLARQINQRLLSSLGPKVTMYLNPLLHLSNHSILSNLNWRDTLTKEHLREILDIIGTFRSKYRQFDQSSTGHIMILKKFMWMDGFFIIMWSINNYESTGSFYCSLE